MDHHCPWINACVGHKNHAHFLRFLLYASTGCFYGGVNLASTVINIIFYVSTVIPRFTGPRFTVFLDITCFFGFPRYRVLQ